MHGYSIEWHERSIAHVEAAERGYSTPQSAELAAKAIAWSRSEIARMRAGGEVK